MLWLGWISLVQDPVFWCADETTTAMLAQNFLIRRSRSRYRVLWQCWQGCEDKYLLNLLSDIENEPRDVSLVYFVCYFIMRRLYSVIIKFSFNCPFWDFMFTFWTNKGISVRFYSNSTLPSCQDVERCVTWLHCKTLLRFLVIAFSQYKTCG